MTRRRATEPAPTRTWRDHLTDPYLLALAAVLALAAAMRFWGLGRESLWWDEAYSVAWSQHDYAWILDLMVNRDYHPPEYYFLLHAWMQAFGSSEVAVRSLSALLGVAGVGAAYMLGRAMFRPAVGLIFAVLVSVSGFHLYYSQETRSYALLFATSVLAMHAYWTFFHGRGDRRLRLTYYVVAAALVLYAHYTGVFVLAAQFVHRATILGMRPERQELKWWAASQAAIGIVYLPWFLVLLRQAGRLQEGFWMGALFEAGAPDFSVSGTMALIAGSGVVALFLWLLIANGLVRATLGGINRERNPDDSDDHNPYPAAKILLLVAWFLCSLLLPYFQSLVSQPIYVSRIMIPALAPFLLLAAVGLGRIRHPVLKLGAIALVVGLSMPGLAAYYGTSAKEEWRQAVADIEAAAAPNATVVLFNWQETNPYSINPWFLYAKRTDLNLVSWVPPELVANETANATDVWLLARQSQPCGGRGEAPALLGQGRQLASCKTYAPDGLSDYPLAGNPLYVHHFVKP